MFRKQVVGILAILSSTAFFSPAHASSIWIDDTNGNIGLVNTATGAVSHVSNVGVLTDIAFIGTQMYGTNFTNLFQINNILGTATINQVGAAYTVGNGGMNALVGVGTSLLAASNATTTVYQISNPSTSSATTNFATGLPGGSAGDLAFAGSTLYESVVDPRTQNDELVNVTTNHVVGFLTIGGNQQNAVFGLADDGTTMFAVQGTRIYTVNLATGALTLDSNYGGQGLGNANGAAFLNESAVPEASTWAMMILGFFGVGFMAYRKKATFRFA
jgi:hypothetical protein